MIIFDAPVDLRATLRDNMYNLNRTGRSSNMHRMKSLIEEARTLATLINIDRFLGVVPSDELTVRLTEVTDLMMDMMMEELV